MNEMLRSLLFETHISEKAALMLAVLLLFIPAIPYLAARSRARAKPFFKAIPGFVALRRFITQAAETGRPVHVSVGLEGIHTVNTAQTLAGLTTLQYLAQQFAPYGSAPLVTVADPTALLAAQDVVRHAFIARGEPGRFEMTSVRLIAPQPAAYAAGVMGILSREAVLGNVMLGTFGDEYLLMGETAAQKGVRQVVGSANIQALPFMYLSADHPIVGEEIFGAGAYLFEIPAHIGSLLAQDWMRIVLVLAIIIGVIWRTIH